MTRYPRQGKGKRWTIAELKAIGSDWKGDTLSDGDGLIGEVRALKDGAVSVRWKYAFKWDCKVCWFQSGSWPALSMEQVRTRRDKARSLLKSGINPNDQKLADRIEAQQRTEAVLAAAEAAKSEEVTVRTMFEAWIENGVRRADGNAELRRAFEKDILPRLGDIQVRKLTDEDISTALKAMASRGVNRLVVQVGFQVNLHCQLAGSRAKRLGGMRPMLECGRTSL